MNKPLNYKPIYNIHIKWGDLLKVYAIILTSMPLGVISTLNSLLRVPIAFSSGSIFIWNSTAGFFALVGMLMYSGIFAGLIFIIHQTVQMGKHPVQDHNNNILYNLEMEYDRLYQADSQGPYPYRESLFYPCIQIY